MNIHIISLLLLVAILGCNNSKLNQQDTIEIKNITFDDFDPHHPPPSNRNVHTFRLSQNYPESIPIKEEPWKEIDFKSYPELYLKKVLDYCLEGNIDVNFDVSKNTIRKWYHAPWLHNDGNECGNGREYIHGLTRERGTPPFEIHNNQDVPLENWAIGFYNELGGYTLGKVWKSNDRPVFENAEFPEGTVSFKLLFTDCGPDSLDVYSKVPFIKNSIKWTANIYPEKPYKRVKGEKICLNTERKNRNVYLLQIDIAVKDKRALGTGWVFGTFIYDGSVINNNPWNRLKPVGLSWGNDPKILSRINDEGAFINPDLKENWLNSELIYSETDNNPNKAYVKTHGVGGRLNGPVDNPVSSCMSCHGNSGITKKGSGIEEGAFGTKRKDITIEQFNHFFSNVSPGFYIRTVDSIDYLNLDYSLQLKAGIRNYLNSLQIIDSTSDKSLEYLLFTKNSLPEINRGEE